MIEVPKKYRYLVPYLSNKWWRLNNLYWIVDEDGNKLKFRCKPAQSWFYDRLHWWNILLKARQWGGTTFVDIYYLDDCIWNSNLEAAIIAHNREDAAKIFRRKVLFPYKNLPEWIRNQVYPTTDSKQELVFSNGSTIYVSTSVRSGTIQRLHISEYGKICRKFPDRAQEIRTGSLNAVHPGSMIVIESTAEGQFGDFYDRCQTAQKLEKEIEAETARLTEMDYKFHFVPWWVEPDYTMDPDGVVIPDKLTKYFAELAAKHGIGLTDGQKAWYAKKAEDQKDMMKQEYPSTPEEAFEQTIEGAYYAQEMTWLREQGRICTVPWEPALPVNVGWDFGLNRSSGQTVLVFHQRFGRENRVIDFYMNHSYGLGHYARYLQDKPYTYGTLYLPHDATVRGYNTKEEHTKNREQLLGELLPNYRIVVVPKIDHHEDGIQAMKNWIPTCWIDKTNCDTLIKALDSYRREWDEKLGAWKGTPLHDWAADPEAGMRSLACGFREEANVAGNFRHHRRPGGMAV